MDETEEADDTRGDAELPWAGNEQVVNYYFPVRVELVGSLPDAEVQRVADFVFGELGRELATRV